MNLKQLDFSEQSWLGSAIIVASALTALLGTSALFWQNAIILLAIAMATGWTLCIGLFVFNAWLRRRVHNLENELLSERHRLETELVAERGRTDHFAATASNVSSSVLTVLRMTPDAPQPPPRLQPRGQTAVASDVEDEGQEA